MCGRTSATGGPNPSWSKRRKHAGSAQKRSPTHRQRPKRSSGQRRPREFRRRRPRISRMQTSDPLAASSPTRNAPHANARLPPPAPTNQIAPPKSSRSVSNRFRGRPSRSPAPRLRPSQHKGSPHPLPPLHHLLRQQRLHLRSPRRRRRLHRLRANKTLRSVNIVATPVRRHRRAERVAVRHSRERQIVRRPTRHSCRVVKPVARAKSSCRRPHAAVLPLQIRRRSKSRRVPHVRPLLASRSKKTIAANAAPAA